MNGYTEKMPPTNWTLIAAQVDLLPAQPEYC
jgi:hypothetical protein